MVIFLLGLRVSAPSQAQAIYRFHYSRMARPRKLKPIMQILRAARAPCTFGMIVIYMLLSMQPDTFENSTVRHVEMFAGTQAVTHA